MLISKSQRHPRQGWQWLFKQKKNIKLEMLRHANWGKIPRHVLETNYYRVGPVLHWIHRRPCRAGNTDLTRSQLYWVNQRQRHLNKVEEKDCRFKYTKWKSKNLLSQKFFGMVTTRSLCGWFLWCWSLRSTASSLPLTTSPCGEVLLCARVSWHPPTMFVSIWLTQTKAISPFSDPS